MNLLVIVINHEGSEVVEFVWWWTWLRECLRTQAALRKRPFSPFSFFWLMTPFSEVIVFFTPIIMLTQKVHFICAFHCAWRQQPTSLCELVTSPPPTLTFHNKTPRHALLAFKPLRCVKVFSPGFGLTARFVSLVCLQCVPALWIKVPLLRNV